MPKRAQRKFTGAAIPPIADEEWDFSGISPDEATYCRYYEFSRHNVSLKAEIASRRANGNWRSGLYPGGWEFYEMRAKLRFFEVFPEFPDIPWLQIPQEVRTQRLRECRLLEGPFLEVAPERMDPDAEHPYWPGDVGSDSIHMVFTAEIDLTAKKTSIIESFERWLNSIHRDVEITKERRGGVTDADLLKALSALRLLEHFQGDWEKAGSWSQIRFKNQKPLYGEQSAWIRAKKKAEKFLRDGIPPSPLGTLLARFGPKISLPPGTCDCEGLRCDECGSDGG